MHRYPIMCRENFRSSNVKTTRTSDISRHMNRETDSYDGFFLSLFLCNFFKFHFIHGFERLCVEFKFPIEFIRCCRFLFISSKWHQINHLSISVIVHIAREFLLVFSIFSYIHAHWFFFSPILLAIFFSVA